MSTVAISYRSIQNASQEANGVARKIDRYAGSLYGHVIRKLNNYNGDWNSNINNVYTKVNLKIENLRSQQLKYSRFASDLVELKNECKSVDKSVRLKVSSLTASFKKAHGMRDSKIENSISRFFINLNNRTSVGRWVEHEIDQGKQQVDYFKDSIKNWYNFDGGKELIKGLVIGALEIAIAVLSIASAIISGGLTLVVIAGIVGGVIALANGAMNIYNEVKAYKMIQDGDPATGRRRHKINSCQDYLRSSFIYGDDGETYHYNKDINDLAWGIDIVSFACLVVNVVNSADKMMKNGYKWATGSLAEIKDIKLKQVFSKDTFKAITTKISDVKISFHIEKWNSKKIGKYIFRDFGKNWKDNFWSFKDDVGKINIKESISSIKNLLGLGKTFIEEGFSLSSISETILPGLTAFTVKVEINKPNISSQINVKAFELTKPITMDDIISMCTKGKKLFTSGKKILNRGLEIKLDIPDVPIEKCNLNISIPDVYIPNISMPILRTGGI